MELTVRGAFRERMAEWYYGSSAAGSMTLGFSVVEYRQLNERRKNMFEDEGYVSGPLMTVADAAKYLGVGRKIVYQLIEGGELNAVRNRGSVLIEKRSLDNYKASGTLS